MARTSRADQITPLTAPRAAPDADSAAPVSRRRKLDRPRELLDAALELFVEKGFATARAEDVAARAGVAKGTLYLYYPSKVELLKAVVAQHLSSELASDTQQALVHGGTSADLRCRSRWPGGRGMPTGPQAASSSSSSPRPGTSPRPPSTDCTRSSPRRTGWSAVSSGAAWTMASFAVRTRPSSYVR